MASLESLELHKLVWLDKPEELKSRILHLKDTVDFRTVDTISALPINNRFHGNTPLCLAIMLGRKKCASVLLENGASCFVATNAGFYPLSEAISLGDRDILREVIKARIWELRSMVRNRNPTLLQSLQDGIKDFYVELKWNFRSWLPFLATLLPHDTCRIWKNGAKVRIDTTIKGFEGYRWYRGDISFIINIKQELSSVFVVDHERKIFDEVNQLRDFEADEIEKSINSYLNTDIINAKLYRTSNDGSQIEFQPRMKKTGWFRKTSSEEQVEELISGYPCRVYDIKNVRWITKTRREHLKDRPNENGTSEKDHQEEREKVREVVTPENKIMSLEELSEETAMNASESEQQQAVRDLIDGYRKSMMIHASSLPPPPPPSVSFEEYFSENGSPEEYIHVGRPMELKVKEKCMKASVWMADNYPLSLGELVPLLGLIAPTNKQFQKLVDFIESDLPEGFPAQIDIPLFSFLSAICTFENFREWDDGFECMPKSRISDDAESWFVIPDDYERKEVIKNIFHEIGEATGASVRLIVVSKNFPVDDISIVYEEGQREFGENYAQELVDKAMVLPKDIKWHFIGGLQKNKLPMLLKCPSLSVIQTVDSIAKAELIETQCTKLGRQIEVFIQVNASNDPGKHGIHPSLVEEASLHLIANMKRCQLTGLMMIGSIIQSSNDEKNPEFELMTRLRDDIEKSSGRRLLLSMGMSSDFRQAISQGSDLVRIGSSIFGHRPSAKPPA